jgi:hypothetical protein
MERKAPGRKTDEENDGKGSEGKVYMRALRRKVLLVG